MGADGAVLREDSTRILGLHAAGEVTGGVHGNNRLVRGTLYIHIYFMYSSIYLSRYIYSYVCAYIYACIYIYIYT